MILRRSVIRVVLTLRVRIIVARRLESLVERGVPESPSRAMIITRKACEGLPRLKTTLLFLFLLLALICYLLAPVNVEPSELGDMR